MYKMYVAHLVAESKEVLNTHTHTHAHQRGEPERQGAAWKSPRGTDELEQFRQQSN